jgi:phosphoglycerate dehydrogenase-like enzyme
MSAPLAVYAFHDDDVAPGVTALEAAGFRVVQAGSDDPSVLARVGADAVALLVAYGTVDAALLARLPALRVVSLISQGHDNVDVPACAQAGVQVAHLPPLATEEVAVHAWALTLASIRQLPFFDRSSRSADTWAARPRFAPRRLSELDVGIVGTGRIAAKYAALAGGHVAAIRSWSRSGRSLAGAASVADLHELLGASDVVSLHLPLTADRRRGWSMTISSRQCARDRGWSTSAAEGSSTRQLSPGHSTPGSSRASRSTYSTRSRRSPATRSPAATTYC